MGRVLEGAERDESLKHFGDNILAIESNRRKAEPGAEEVHDAFIADICSSIDNAVKILDSKEKITLDRINRPKKPKQLSASEPTALPKGIWEELEGSVCAGKKLTLDLCDMLNRLTTELKAKDEKIAGLKRDIKVISKLQDENAKLRETLEAISAHEDDLHKCGIGYDNYVDRKVKQALKGDSDGN